MEELLFFIVGMIAEALGLKKKATPPPDPLSPTRRPMPTSLSENDRGGRTTFPALFPRRPEAGDPLVSPDATTESFAVREQALEEAEPAAQSAPPALNTAPQSPTPALFVGTEDFVRAFVLQEALGPPLCRRRGMSP